MQLSTQMKAVIMAAVPLITALALYSQSGEINVPEFSLGVLALIGTVSVLVTTNAPEGWQRFAKFLVSASAAVVTAAVTALFSGDWSSAEWTTLLVGLFTSVLVYLAAEPPATSTGVRRS